MIRKSERYRKAERGAEKGERTRDDDDDDVGVRGNNDQ